MRVRFMCGYFGVGGLACCVCGVLFVCLIRVRYRGRDLNCLLFYETGWVIYSDAGFVRLFGIIRIRFLWLVWLVVFLIVWFGSGYLGVSGRHGDPQFGDKVSWFFCLWMFGLLG